MKCNLFRQIGTRTGKTRIFREKQLTSPIFSVQKSPVFSKKNHLSRLKKSFFSGIFVASSFRICYNAHEEEIKNILQEDRKRAFFGNVRLQSTIRKKEKV